MAKLGNGSIHEEITPKTILRLREGEVPGRENLLMGTARALPSSFSIAFRKKKKKSHPKLEV